MADGLPEWVGICKAVICGDEASDSGTTVLSCVALNSQQKQQMAFGDRCFNILPLIDKFEHPFQVDGYYTSPNDGAHLILTLCCHRLIAFSNTLCL